MFRQKTKAVWVKHFPEEPFDLDESKGNSPQEFPNGLVSKIGYNIEEAALRQRDFYYQVRICVCNIATSETFHKGWLTMNNIRINTWHLEIGQ